MPSFIQEDMQSSGFSQTALLDFKRPRPNAGPPSAFADEAGEAVDREQLGAFGEEYSDGFSLMHNMLGLFIQLLEYPIPAPPRAASQKPSHSHLTSPPPVLQPIKSVHRNSSPKAQ